MNKIADKCSYCVVNFGLERLLSLIIYSLPLIFFVISYFLIIVSGEDIHQGAGLPVDILGDARAAFSWNGRWSDMYAWSVINFFDYQYNFGIDTLFRLIDVALGMGILYLMTMIAIGRKPKLELRDAILFGMAFLVIFLTPHGRPLYAGFSAIHNYLLITVTSLLFLLPYALDLTGAKRRHSGKLAVAMLVMGFIFGLSSNVTPLAFLLTAVVVFAIDKLRPKKLSRAFALSTSWKLFGILGAVIGLFVMYVFGPGVSGYAISDYATKYGYVAFSQIFTSPISSALAIVGHMISNYGRVLAPLLLIIVGSLTLYTVLKRKNILQNIKVSSSEWRFLSAGIIFIAIHILILSQIESPLRIMLPAYVVGVIIVLFFGRHLMDALSLNYTKKNLLIIGGVITTFMVIAVATRFILAINYSHQVRPVLERIQNSPNQSLCVTRESVRSRVLPSIYLGQEDMLADWAMPETVYGKVVKFCR